MSEKLCCGCFCVTEYFFIIENLSDKILIRSFIIVEKGQDLETSVETDDL